VSAMAMRRYKQSIGAPSRSDDDAERVAAVMRLRDALRAEEAARPSRRGGSVIGRHRVLRGLRHGDERLYTDYFGPNPVYGPDTFRRR
jgi:hypothetical protein